MTEGLRTNLVMCTQFYFALFFKHTSPFFQGNLLFTLLFCPYTYVGFSGGTVQFSSVSQLCPILCNPMDWSTPGFHVHHQALELVQTHAHWVSDAIQPSYPLLSPSLPAFSLSSIRVISSESILHIRWLKYWSFNFCISPYNEYSRLISFRIDWFDLLAIQGTVKSLL